MSALASWTRFLDGRLGKPPLGFVTGMLHRVPRGDYCGVHSHREIEIVYHPSGRGTTSLPGFGELAFAPGDAVLYPSGARHDQTMTEAGDDLCVQISMPPGLGTRRRPSAPLLIGGLAGTPCAEALGAMARRYPALSGADRAILDLRATALLLELIGIARVREEQGALTEGERHVARAEGYIAENFARIDSLGEVAKAVGVSHDHLRHLFRQWRGKSLVRHLNEVRIERAKTLLVQSILPLKQVSALCGFADEYYFSTVFRSIARTTPGRHRQAGARLRSS